MGYEFHKRPSNFRTAADPDLLLGTVQESITTSTAASTALGPRGNFALQTTSTGAPVVYTLADASTTPNCDVIRIVADLIASSSVGPFHINVAGTVGSSSDDMVVLSTIGAGITLMSMSTSRWGVVGNYNSTFSTST